MKRTHLTIVAASLGALASSACTSSEHSVIAATGTNIGLEIAQAPANGTPQAKLGYNRAEIALVRPDRYNDGTGKDDVANVLMELRYSNILSADKGSIYQRLAVGKTAVSQPGASVLMAKNADGDLDKDALEAAVSVMNEDDLDFPTD